MMPVFPFDQHKKDFVVRNQECYMWLFEKGDSMVGSAEVISLWFMEIACA